MEALTWFWPFMPLVLVMAMTATNYLEEKNRLAQEIKERRYLEAVAMLTAEEKREIGIE